MGKVQFIKAGDGSEMAVIPRTDYERLIAAEEERADNALADAAERRLAEGEETVSLDMAKRVLAGEHPVRVWREHRGLRVGELAARAGLTQPQVSYIETGKRKGTFETMIALARALAVDLDDLVPSEPKRPS